MSEKKFSIVDLNEVNHEIQWCPGCGDFGILFAIKKAIVSLGINPKDVVVVSGIGCSGKLPHYIKTYGVEALHGRALPVATGVKFANPDLHVIVVGGDGDGYGIGVGHLVHSIRRDINLTYIVHNNETYGLTKGQASPTTKVDSKTSSTPFGVVDEPLNPLAMAISLGGSFVARGYSQDMVHLANLISEGIMHKGFSLIDVIQPCVSYDHLGFKLNKLQVSKLESNDITDKNKAFELSIDNSDVKKIGIFYKSERESQESKSLVELNIEKIEIDKLYDEYK